MPGDDPPTLGTFCSFQTCETVDFLPLKCPHCLHSFCDQHGRLPASHACSKEPPAETIKGNRFEDKFNDLLPDPNRRVTDREDADQERAKKREAALALLSKNFGADKVAQATSSGALKAGGLSSNSAAPSSKPTKPVSPIVALMKLKQRAKQGDPRKGAGDVPMDQRWFWTTSFLDSKTGSTVVKELWMPKTTNVGKVLDLLASEHFRIENVNNTSTDPAKVRHIHVPMFFDVYAGNLPALPSLPPAASVEITFR
ncbi:hypothetical protein T439DRAFT_322086 [Meredithblackwellia eburnea MCA 4105]